VSSKLKTLVKEVQINVVRQSDRLTIFHIDGPAFFPEIGSFFKGELCTVERAYGLSNKAIAVVTNCRLDNEQFAALRRLIGNASGSDSEQILFRALQKNTKLADELRTLTKNRVPALSQDF